MRAIWKGAITFGLVSVPIKLYSATEEHDVELHQVHDADGGRIRYQRRCEVCGKVVEYAHIDKAYTDGGATVVLTEDDLSSLPVERSREVEVVEFVPSDQIDPIRLDRSYFCEPDGSSTKAYGLLRRTLEETDRTAIVQFSLRQKTRLGALRARPGAGRRPGILVLQALRWDDELRDADFPGLADDPKVSAQELRMAASLVDNLSADFTPEKFTDAYAEQLRTLIEAKLAEGDALDTEATFGDAAAAGKGADVVDLMEALRRSVEQHRAGRADPDGSQKPTARKGAAKKKAPAKKSSAKKAPAKKRAQKAS